MNRATIDIGSNSILLLIVSSDGVVLHDEARVVGLGKGLGDRGLLQPQRMDAALAVLSDYAALTAQHSVPAWMVKAVATSGARRALNAQAFLERVRTRTGLRVRVVSGEEEAWLTWAGARADLRLPGGPLAVVDPGGGSTELVLGEGERVSMKLSLELGVVRLTERHFGPDPARYRPQQLARLRAEVRGVLNGIQWSTHPRALIAVAGTVTTIAAMHRGLKTWQREAIHGSRLSRGVFRRWVDRLLDSSPSERREWAAVAPQRADYLLAGACLLEEFCTAAHRDSLLVSDGGVRYGLLHEY